VTTPQVRQVPVHDGRATFKVDQRAVLAVSATDPLHDGAGELHNLDGLSGINALALLNR